MPDFQSTLIFNIRILYWHIQLEQGKKWPTILFNDYHYQNYLADGWFCVYCWFGKSLNNKEYK
jgi:hypothetical protein